MELAQNPALYDDLVAGFLRLLATMTANNTTLGDSAYGVAYENDVFMMHPYCWCEKEDCPWCTDNPDIGRPNFLYKPTGWHATWYKTIGRLLVYDDLQPEQFVEMMHKCVASVPAELRQTNLLRNSLMYRWNKLLDRAFTEDDCTVSDPDFEDWRKAYNRLTGTEFAQDDVEVSVDRGDHDLILMKNGWMIVKTWPGECEIKRPRYTI